MILADTPAVTPVNTVSIGLPASEGRLDFLIFRAERPEGITLVVVMIQGNVAGRCCVFFIIIGQRKMVGHFFIIVVSGIAARIPQAPVIAEMAVGKGERLVFCQLPVNTEVHFPPVHGRVGHGLFISVTAFIMHGLQIGTSAGSGPAPAFAAARQLGFPSPGVVRSPGRFKPEDMFPAFFCNNIDNAGGGIVV